MPLNKDYLQGAYDAFVNSAIQRVARSGDQVYHFNIPANELKDAFGLERLREEHPDVERTDETGRRTRLTEPEPEPAPTRVARSVPRSILDPTKPRPSILGPNPRSRPARTNKILRSDKLG